jgi:hypothetical protein
MKQFIRHLFMLTLFVALTASCEKEDPLPKASQSGANIMAAKINGQRWEQFACWSCIGAGSGLTASYNPGKISGIKGEERQEDSDIVIRIFFYEITGPGTYVLGNRNNPGRPENFAEVSFFHEKKHYTTTNQSRGTLVITRLDTVTKIMSGTFEFTGEDETNPASIIRVTDGRFDVKY